MSSISNDMNEMNEMLKGLNPLKIINLEIESNSKERFSTNMIGYESVLEIKIKTLNNEPNKEYEERFSLNNIKKINKYFLMCESIIDVISSIEPNIKQSKIIEDKNNINFIIPINHPLCKEIIFQIKEKIKIFTSSELYNIISDLRNNISELRNNNQILTERVKILERKLKEKEEIKVSNKNEITNSDEEILFKSIKSNNYNLYNDFNIALKESIHQLNYHTHYVYCSTLLRDGRFATCSLDHSIIIYNDKTFKPDITIKEHDSHVYCIIQLSIIQLRFGILVSGSNDKTIKLYDINGNEYKVIQTLTYHTSEVKKIIELKNNKLVSCSADESIIFYFKDNNEYIKDYSISTNGYNGPVIQTKDNEICYHEYNNNSALCFYDLLERKIITKINNISVSYCIYDSLVMMTKDLLLATGENKLSIININLHNIIRTIDVSGSSSIYCACMLNENILLTGDGNKRIMQWKIVGDNLQLISKKENAHESWIGTLSKIGNGLIISGSGDNFVKIW